VDGIVQYDLQFCTPYQIEATITPVQALPESRTDNNTVLTNALGNTRAAMF